MTGMPSASMTLVFPCSTQRKISSSPPTATMRPSLMAIASAIEKSLSTVITLAWWMIVSADPGGAPGVVEQAASASRAEAPNRFMRGSPSGSAVYYAFEWRGILFGSYYDYPGDMKGMRSCPQTAASAPTSPHRTTNADSLRRTQPDPATEASGTPGGLRGFV